jgi:hypothetical protein
MTSCLGYCSALLHLRLFLLHPMTPSSRHEHVTAALMCRWRCRLLARTFCAASWRSKKHAVAQLQLIKGKKVAASEVPPVDALPQPTRSWLLARGRSVA